MRKQTDSVRWFILEMFNWTDNKAVTIHHKLEPLLLLDSFKIGLNAENWALTGPQGHVTWKLIEFTLKYVFKIKKNHQNSIKRSVSGQSLRVNTEGYREQYRERPVGATMGTSVFFQDLK